MIKAMTIELLERVIAILLPALVVVDTENANTDQSASGDTNTLHENAVGAIARSHHQDDLKVESLTKRNGTEDTIKKPGGLSSLIKLLLGHIDKNMSPQ